MNNVSNVNELLETITYGSLVRFSEVMRGRQYIYLGVMRGLTPGRDQFLVNLFLNFAEHSEFMFRVYPEQVLEVLS
jgi:hypothetical protein